MEVWKDVEGFSGYYEVSNHGRVRSVNRRVHCAIRNNPNVVKRGRILKPQNQRGYLSVRLCKEGTGKIIMVHRIVASAFLDRPDGKDFVNHKNGNKADNRVENLEWCTAQENSIHAVRTGLLVPPEPQNRKKIRCCETGEIFEGSYRAAEWLNHSKFSYSKSIPTMAVKIRHCCSGKIRSAYGYHWKDVE